MAAPTFTKNPLQIKTGPGLILYNLSLAGTLPTFVAAGSKFTNDWTGWGKTGFTDDGLTITFTREMENVDVAESLYPVRKVPNSAGCQVAFSASGLNEDNMVLSQAGGTWTTQSGTAATLVRKYTPPDPTELTRVMLGFMSAETDEAFVWYQAFQGGEVTMARQKGAQKASFSGLNFEIEVPDAAVASRPWNYWTAGVWSAPIV